VLLNFVSISCGPVPLRVVELPHIVSLHAAFTLEGRGPGHCIKVDQLGVLGCLIVDEENTPDLGAWNSPV
jgi:hypothetical protein